MIVSGVIFLFGGLFQINPVWLYGPYTPYTVSSGSQPDWYLGWLDGSVRLWPHWEFRSFGHEIANPVFPGLLIPGLVFTLMYAWPWIDKKIYNDYRAHNLLDRPRDKPFRTGVGVAAIIFFSVLTLACATDLLANNFHIAFERLIEILQYSVAHRSDRRLLDRLQGLPGAAALGSPPHPAPGGWDHHPDRRRGLPHPLRAPWRRARGGEWAR